MALTQIPGGFYDHGSHGYYSPSGRFVPSVTQILSLVGLVNYDHVPQETLRAKAALGTKAHELFASRDLYGAIDPSWIPEECKPYVDAYQQFCIDKHWQPYREWVEAPVIATLYGRSFGVTPDGFGLLDGVKTVLEKKNVESASANWGFQTSFQEAAILGSVPGQAQRAALQLCKNGKYKLDHHGDHHGDRAIAVAALTIVWARIDNGEPIWESV